MASSNALLQLANQGLEPKKQLFKLTNIGEWKGLLVALVFAGGQSFVGPADVCFSQCLGIKVSSLGAALFLCCSCFCSQILLFLAQWMCYSNPKTPDLW